MRDRRSAKQAAGAVAARICRGRRALLAVASCAIAIAVAACGLVSPASGQVAPFEETQVSLRVDSGRVLNRAAGRQVIWSQVVHVADVASLRLTFSKAILGEAPPDGRPTVLRITSLFDHGVQELTAEQLKQWRNSTAYFNGSALLLEIEADEGAAFSRVVIKNAKAAPVRPPADDEADARSLCDSTDDRVLSSDPRIGRSVPVGCTVWLIDDLNHCMLTAGHCGMSMGSDLVEFNVPLSAANGTWIHSDPDDQYVVDQSSIQFSNNGVGDDWQYFGCFANPNTGLTAAQAQGDWFILDFSPPNPSGQLIRVTGYGVTSPPVSPTLNRAQKTHTGSYESVSAATHILQYRVDTTGGNSGSPVIDESNGLAIGIHTHAGCTTNGNGANNGTTLNETGLLNALANPLGVCAPQPPANDNCSGAKQIAASPVAFDTTFATNASTTESCGTIFNDVWYRLSVAETCELALTVCDAAFDASIAVYGAGCPGGNFTALACATIDCDDALTLQVNPGVYRIRVGAAADEEGAATLYYVCSPLPDPCDADCVPSGGDGQVTVSDIIAIIIAFGSTGEGLACDIAPPGGDGVITVSDVLAAIEALGASCP